MNSLRKMIEEKDRMNEERKALPGYEGLYEMTKSGRVISLRQQRPMKRCNDEYGFHIVKLTNHDGVSENHIVFDLWKAIFPGRNEHEFKGALKPKYGAKCKLLNDEGIHFQ